MQKSVRAILACLALAACSTAQSMTPYQDPGMTGGVTQTPETDGTWNILAHGNGYTPLQAVKDYTYLRAAELADAEGAHCFAVVSEFAEMRRTVVSNPYSGGDVHHFPTARLRVRMLPDLTECGEHRNVAAVLAELRPRVADRTYYNEIRQSELSQRIGRD